MSAFVYCRCPDCGFSVIMAGEHLANGEGVACPACWRRGVRPEVAMTKREARDDDKVDGLDARERVPVRYFCARCGNECVSNRTAASANAEFLQQHGRPFRPGIDVTLCDDCHNRRPTHVARRLS